MKSASEKCDMGSSRRRFMRESLGALAIAGFPTIVPSRVLGKAAPSNLIQIGQIGCGRIARTHDMKETIKLTDVARFVAVSDVDSVRIADSKTYVESYYAGTCGSSHAAGVKMYKDYHEMLEDTSIDAVIISTPDHWHAQPAIEAALAGKDIYLQKPASLTIREGRQMADVIKKTGRILQMGTQQRSELQFRLACELVRNGRIGKVKEILIGLPVDPSGDEEAQMPVPGNLDYNAWLGSTPEVYYTEKRVHPQSQDRKVRYDRPGWLRCEQFGAGMITGWGAHHIDIAHWALGTEHTGPIEVSALAQFPKRGLWDVHGSFQVRFQYANGATVYLSDKYPTGERIIGEDGWIWVSRGSYKPGDPQPGAPRSAVFDASDVRILREGIRPNEIHLHESHDHHLDWLESVKTRKEPAAPAEVGHRTCSACLIAHTAMKLGRDLRWDPDRERFINDDEANGMLARPQRAPFGTDLVLQKHGIATTR
ncbi:MAG: Gfo/Idh/MocA family oxidoreductase [Bryobacteraceae bacterium]